MRRMDMKTIRLMNVDAPSIAQAGTLLPQIDFLMPDYGHAGANVYSELTYTLPTGQPVFRAATNGSGPENLAAQIRARAGAARARLRQRLHLELGFQSVRPEKDDGNSRLGLYRRPALGNSTRCTAPRKSDKIKPS